MPVVGKPEFDEEKRASWFSHKGEVALPHYYKVYLAEHDVVTEFTPTDRAVLFRFTFPENDHSYIVVDAFDKGSYVKILPEQNRIIGYTTRNSGGVPENFKNYFVIEFDKPFTFNKVWADYHTVEKHLELQSNHVGAAIGFSTKKGEQVHAKVASSFISPEQAELNLKEIGKKSIVDKMIIVDTLLNFLLIVTAVVLCKRQIDIEGADAGYYIAAMVFSFGFIIAFFVCDCITLVQKWKRRKMQTEWEYKQIPICESYAKISIGVKVFVVFMLVCAACILGFSQFGGVFSI